MKHPPVRLKRYSKPGTWPELPTGKVYEGYLSKVSNTFYLITKHTMTWYIVSLGQRSLIDFCVASTDLFQSVLNIRVKCGTELPTDRRLASLQLTF